jgi:hypothetical protein
MGEGDHATGLANPRFVRRLTPRAADPMGNGRQRTGQNSKIAARTHTDLSPVLSSGWGTQLLMGLPGVETGDVPDCYDASRT